LRISAKIEGKETGDWVLIDAGDVIVHVFRPEVREFYQLEKMWLPRPGSARGRPPRSDAAAPLRRGPAAGRTRSARWSTTT
jgi:hypothetical protein